MLVGYSYASFYYEATLKLPDKHDVLENKERSRTYDFTVILSLIKNDAEDRQAPQNVSHLHF